MSREASPPPEPSPLTAEELPLYKLFQDLRDAGLPLGTADYLELLRALRLGEGMADRAALLRLCRLLWTGTREEARILERLFHRAVPAPVPGSASASAPGSAPAPAPGSAPAPAPAPGSASASAPEPPPLSAGGRAVEISLAMLAGAPGGVELSHQRGAAADEYLPVTARQMRQSFRRLRRMERRGPRTEPDLDATVSRIAREGIFLGPTLVGRRTNAERLILLIDRDGSMTPFQVVARRLIETARRGGRLAHVGVYYFHNTPIELDAGFAVQPEAPAGDMVPLGDLLAASPRATTGVLIVSDAGAARRTYSTERLEATRGFLAALHAGIRRVAWLNPVPRDRWPGTTAQPVRALVPMFEADRAGLDAALRVLRGRRPHPHGAL